MAARRVAGRHAAGNEQRFNVAPERSKAKPKLRFEYSWADSADKGVTHTGTKERLNLLLKP